MSDTIYIDNNMGGDGPVAIFVRGAAVIYTIRENRAAPDFFIQGGGGENIPDSGPLARGHRIMQISPPLPSLTIRCKVSWNFSRASIGIR